MNFREHLIVSGSSIKEALARLNVLGADAIIFVVDANCKLIGSLTDGDVRRGFLKGLGIDNSVDDFLQQHPSFIRKHKYSIYDVIDLRNKTFKVIPVLNDNDEIINIINFRYIRSFLPLDSVIMAGGRGVRLSPLTDTVPKPLLKVGDKAIIEHNIDFIRKYGVSDFWLSIRYLGDQIEDHFKDGKALGINIKYVREDTPLGTIGSVSKLHDLNHDHILISNSDILTTLDYEDFYIEFIKSGADMAIASVPYTVNIPYAVLDTDNNRILSFKEKPSYTYHSNGGIYLLKKEILEMVPKDTFFNATDLMELLIARNFKLISYPMRNYWLDIGNPEDFEKAKLDVAHLDL